MAALLSMFLENQVLTCARGVPTWLCNVCIGFAVHMLGLPCLFWDAPRVLPHLCRWHDNASTRHYEICTHLIYACPDNYLIRPS